MSMHDNFACVRSTVKTMSGFPEQGEAYLAPEESNVFNFFIPLNWV